MLVTWHWHVHVKGSIGGEHHEFVLAFPAVSCFLVHLIWMVLAIEGRWLYSCCFVGYYFQDLFNIACSILVQFLFGFFSIHLVSIHVVVHLYYKIHTTAAWKKFCFILLDKSDFHMIDSLLITIHTFTRCILMSLLVDEMLLSRYVNLSTNFRELPIRVEMSPWLKHMYSVLSAFTWRPMPPAAWLDSLHRGKIEQILLAYSLPKETVTAIMMCYSNTKIKVCSPDGDTNYLWLLLEFCKGGNIIGQGYILQMFIDLIKENDVYVKGFGIK